MGKRLKDIPKEFRKLLFLKPKQKFLGFIKGETLQIFENKLTLNLGSYKRKSRPLIFWVDNKNLFNLLFLTASRKTISVNLSFCREKEKLCSDFPFYSNSYVLLDLSFKPTIFKIKDPSLIESIYFCGHCENLEHLEKFRIRAI